MNKEVEKTLKMSNEEILNELMSIANIKNEDIERITNANDAYFQDFLATPNKETFSRMAVADLTVRAIVKEIKQIGPEKLYEEAQKSDFISSVIKAVGVFAMLGVRMGYAHETED